MLILALGSGKVWHDIRSSSPAPSLNNSPTARQNLIPASPRVRHPVEPAVEGRDVENVEVSATEGAVCRAAGGGQEVLLQHRAIRDEDRDAGSRSAPLPTTGGDDVAAGVPAHAVDSPRL